MNWYREFKGQDYGMPTYKHSELPLYITEEFSFFRCVPFDSSFYGKTASDLFNGNLRICSGRYSKLFPGRLLSYWADHPATALAEIRKHGSGNDVLTFWAYDDASSTFPIFPNREKLMIVDGRKCGVQELIDKLDNDENITGKDREYLNTIMSYDPDCLAFDSHARKGGENYLFFEKGFKKLALRELKLRFGKEHGGSSAKIVCAGTCDYTPYLNSYGECFLPKARVKMCESYLCTDEYQTRVNAPNESLRIIRGQMNE